MPGMTCDMLGCSLPIRERCSQCQGSYCTRHIVPQRMVCDGCIRRSVSKKQKIGKWVMRYGCFCLLWTLLGLVLGDVSVGGQVMHFGSMAQGGLFISIVILAVGAILKRG